MQRMVMSRLRRQAWMKWFPPIAAASPSPVMTMARSSGRARSAPVATAGALPWRDQMASNPRYWEVTREEHPIPATKQK